MVSDFDSAAPTYDQDFTNSFTGKAQRNQVYRFLKRLLQEHNCAAILEINCGTGTDAMWFAEQHLKVIATDVSAEMIKVAKRKGQNSNLEFVEADINSLNVRFKPNQFDLIFSNFGGLNCLSEEQLTQFFETAQHLLNKNGLMALVIMPRQTKWEQLYFLTKANWKNAFRRKKKCADANVSGQTVRTYYYNPKETLRLIKNTFAVERICPVGFFLPPSYLEPFFKNSRPMLRGLETLERKIENFSFLSAHADHYLLVLRKT